MRIIANHVIHAICLTFFLAPYLAGSMNAAGE